ncbi:MAG TPA: hypothetical protein VIL65_17605 [Beijerinckiaceae bacterium]
MSKPNAIPAIAAVLALLSAGLAQAQSVDVSSPKDFMLLAQGIEVAEEICDNVDIAADELVEIGEAKHFFRGKVGVSKVELGAAKAAMEANAKKDKATYCGEIARGYKAMYRAILDQAQ